MVTSILLRDTVTFRARTSQNTVYYLVKFTPVQHIPKSSANTELIKFSMLNGQISNKGKS